MFFLRFILATILLHGSNYLIDSLINQIIINCLTFFRYHVGLVGGIKGKKYNLPTLVYQHCTTVQLSVMMEMFFFCANMAATCHMWLLNTHVASVSVELNC